MGSQQHPRLSRRSRHMIGLPAPVPVVDDEVGPERGSNVWRQLRRNPAFWMGAIGVLVIVGLAIDGARRRPVRPALPVPR